MRDKRAIAIVILSVLVLALLIAYVGQTSELREVRDQRTAFSTGLRNMEDALRKQIEQNDLLQAQINTLVMNLSACESRPPVKCPPKPSTKKPSAPTGATVAPPPGRVESVVVNPAPITKPEPVATSPVVKPPRAEPYSGGVMPKPPPVDAENCGGQAPHRPDGFGPCRDFQRPGWTTQSPGESPSGSSAPSSAAPGPGGHGGHGGGHGGHK